MKLYHGGTAIIEVPQILPVSRPLDFHQGFYTTTSKEQAEKWAMLKRDRGGTGHQAVVNVYEFDTTVLNTKMLNVLEFKNADDKWLDFVFYNRSDVASMHNYDLVIGPVANDKVFNTLTLYETGILSKEETLLRLKTHLLFDQYSFHTIKALNLLQFDGSFFVNDEQNKNRI